MKVYVSTKPEDQNIEISLFTPLDQAEFRETLPARLVDSGAEFESALVVYDDEHSHECNDLQSLLDQLGKFGG